MDGVDDYVELPSTLDDGLTDMTFVAWVKWGGGGNWQYLLNVSGAVGSDKFMFLTPKNGETGKVRFLITTSGSGGAEYVDGSSALPVDTWAHIAIVLEGNTATLYRNGNVDGSGTINLDPQDLAASLNYFGKSVFSGNPYFKGDLDEVYLYKRALSQVEIQNLMGGGTGIILFELGTSNIGLENLQNPIEIKMLSGLIKNRSLNLYDFSGMSVNSNTINNSGVYILRDVKRNIMHKVIVIE